MDTFPLVYPHVLGECHIQPAKPDALGLMSQGGNYSLVIFLYPCDKDWSDREDRVASICAAYQNIESFGNRNFQFDQHWS
jgi:alpha-glucuronidase